MSLIGILADDLTQELGIHGFTGERSGQRPKVSRLSNSQKLRSNIPDCRPNPSFSVHRDQQTLFTPSSSLAAGRRIGARQEWAFREVRRLYPLSPIYKSCYLQYITVSQVQVQLHVQGSAP
jgi:hypothetical protein